MHSVVLTLIHFLRYSIISHCNLSSVVMRCYFWPQLDALYILLLWCRFVVLSPTPLYLCLLSDKISAWNYCMSLEKCIFFFLYFNWCAWLVVLPEGFLSKLIDYIHIEHPFNMKTKCFSITYNALEIIFNWFLY